MDSLKSLMDKRQYDLVLKLTENSADPTYLFYRISAFLALGKAEESLKCLEDNRLLLQKDLSLLIKVHIETLCLLGMFDKAYEEMKYYQNLPYNSQVVEELLAKLPEYIRAEEKKAYSSHELADYQVSALARSEELNDAIIALDLIKNRDVNKFLDDLRWLMTNHPAQSIRSFALFVLVQKKVPGVFVFKHIDTNIEVEPSKLEPPFMGEWFNNIVRRLSTEIKNATIVENAIQILSSYLMYIYPDKVDYSDDILIDALYRIANNYLSCEPDPGWSGKEDEYLNENVKELMDKINQALENF